MSIYGSGSIRFNGLGSETNFDDMIEKLHKIESRKASQLLRWRNDWQVRLDAFKQVRADLMTMQSALSKLNSMNKFMIKTAVSSNTTVASATADASAMDAAFHLEVDRLARAFTWSQNTGLHHRTDVIANQPGGGTFEYTYKGTTRTIQVPQGTTAEGLVRLINNDSQNPGARAQLIQSGDGITFQMFGMDTGRSNTLIISKTDGLTLNTSAIPRTYSEDPAQGLAQLVTRNFGTDETAARATVINTSTQNTTFNYTVDGQRFSLTVTPSMTTLGQLMDAINAQHPNQNPPLASLQTRADGHVYPTDDPGNPAPPPGALYFTLQKPNVTYSFAAGADPGDSAIFNQFINAPFTNPNNINDGATDIILNFTIDGGSGGPLARSVTITPGMSAAQFRNALQAEVGGFGTVHLRLEGGQQLVAITPTTTQHRVTVEDGTLEGFAYEVPDDVHWNIIRGENARIKVNGWPDGAAWFESASNTIAAGAIVEGVSFRLLNTGATTITTGTDTEKIRENIENFLTAINDFRTALRALTVVDEQRRTWDPRLAESQFEMQKGNVLTGNYGIQMIESRLKMALAGAAIGFLPRQNSPNGGFSGDIFSSLSQIGITTEADVGNINFGLLVVNDISGARGSKSLEDALREDPMAVARLFAASNEGFTDSADFGYHSQVSNVTRAGNYSVRYTVNADGEIGQAWINGEEASIDRERGQITSVSGPSRGLVLDIYPHSLVPGSEVTGTVSLREGKVNEILRMLSGSEGILGTSGTLRNLERNYQEIIDNIEAKLLREDERLARWERTMINKFARLDTVLARYSALNDSIQAQIAQLAPVGGNRR